MHLTLVVDDVPFEVWLKRVEDTVEVEVEGVVHRFRAEARGGDVVLHPLEGDAARADGPRGPHRVEAPEVGRMVADGAAMRIVVARFEPGGGPGHHAAGHGTGGAVRTPMPGKVVALHKRAGEEVARGETVLVLEAMKMQVKVPSPCDGRVHKVLVAEGATVDAAAVLFHVTAEKRAGEA